MITKYCSHFLAGLACPKLVYIMYVHVCELLTYVHLYVYMYICQFVCIYVHTYLCYIVTYMHKHVGLSIPS